MSKLKDIESQIAKLEREAQAIAISTVKELVVKHGLTAEMIGLSGKRGGGGVPAKKTATVSAAGVPKYRDPKSGKTWTGRGKPPLWLAKSRNRDKFLIDKPAADVAAPAAQAAPQAPAAPVTPVKAAKAVKARVKKQVAPATKSVAKAEAKVEAKPSAKVATKKAPAKKAPAKAVKTTATKPATKKSAPAKAGDGAAAGASPAAAATA